MSKDYITFSWNDRSFEIEEALIYSLVAAMLGVTIFDSDVGASGVILSLIEFCWFPVLNASYFLGSDEGGVFGSGPVALFPQIN